MKIVSIFLALGSFFKAFFGWNQKQSSFEKKINDGTNEFSAECSLTNSGSKRSITASVFKWICCDLRCNNFLRLQKSEQSFNPGGAYIVVAQQWKKTSDCVLSLRENINPLEVQKSVIMLAVVAIVVRSRTLLISN